MGTNTKVIVKIGMLPDFQLSSDIVEVVVDTSVFLPAMCTISFMERIPNEGFILTHIDNSFKFRMGESVMVTVITEDFGSNPLPEGDIIFKGEITAIEPVFEKSGKALLRIRAMNKCHRLTKGKKFRTFAMMTDDLIISKIVTEAKLTPIVDPERLTTLYTNVIQYDQSDWDFLWDRAQLFGYQMYGDELGLHFEKVGMLHGLPINLSWGRDLVQFEPRLVSMGQVTKAEVGGWDPMLKKEIVSMIPGIASAPLNIIGDPLSGPATEAMVFGGKSTDYSVDEPIHNIAQAMGIAGGLMDSHATQFVRASGEVNTCIPGLLAGAKVVITNVGVRFAGEYYVSEAKHVYRGGDYRILFQVTGHNPYTIKHLLTGGDGDANKIPGVVIGVVTNVQDPMMLGRVKVKYPWIPVSPAIEGDWARIASLGTGSAGGLMFLPEVNDEVLVAFEHGNINFPYIVGLLWNSKDRPPQGSGPSVVAGKVSQRIIRSRSGHTIIFDDTDGKEQIIIKDKTSNNSIIFNSITNAMTIKAQGDLTIEAGGKLTLKSNLDLSVTTETKGSISANTSLELKGNSSVKMDAGPGSVEVTPADSSIKGVKVDVQANTQASISGTAMVQIQGGMVMIN